jgi:hypothetical protein
VFTLTKSDSPSLMITEAVRRLESTDVGWSLAEDVRKKAKTKVKARQGDRAR